jgi:hypothetical protein
VSEDQEFVVHILQSELTQILEKIVNQYTDTMSHEQINDYLGNLISSLQFFQSQGNYDRMIYDLKSTISFLPSAFPIQ